MTCHGRAAHFTSGSVPAPSSRTTSSCCGYRTPTETGLSRALSGNLLVVIHAQLGLPLLRLVGLECRLGRGAPLAALLVAVEVLPDPTKGLQVERGLPRLG